MKLFKKLILSLCALMLLGMLASCGGGAGGGEPSGDGYKVVYNGTIVMDDLDEEDIAMFQLFYNMQSPEDYSIDQGTKTITLTSDGMAKFNNAFETYTFVYNNETILTTQGMMLPLVLYGYTEDTDYERDDTQHIITVKSEGLYNSITTIQMGD